MHNLIELIILIQVHYLVYQDQITGQNGSPAAMKATNRLLRNEMIKVDLAACRPSAVDGRCQPRGERRTVKAFKTTARGAAHLEKIIALPLPVLEETWV